MSDRLVGYLVGLLLKNLDTAVVARLIVAAARTAVAALKKFADDNETDWRDQVVVVVERAVEELASKLGVP